MAAVAVVRPLGAPTQNNLATNSIPCRSTEAVDKRQQRGVKPWSAPVLPGDAVPEDRLLSPRQGFSKKVSALDHLEFRVWAQRMLSADNFGVLPFTAAKLQADNLALAREPAADVLRALEKTVEVGLSVKFSHQGEAFSADPRWQEFQKIRYPRRTIYPCPSAELLRTFSAETRELFRQHHGNFPKNSGKISRTRDRSGRPDHRLTANGSSRSRSSEGESEGKPVAVEFKIADSLLDAIGKCRRLGAVPKLRDPDWWQAEIRANSGKGIDYPAHVLEVEAYLATVPANRYQDLARFLHNSFARKPKL